MKKLASLNIKDQPQLLLYLYLLIGLLIFLSKGSQAQNINDGFEADTNEWVRAVVVQANGQIIVAGDFTSIANQPKSHIAKLYVDGSLDTGFNPSVNGDIWDVVIQDNGYIIIAGDFTEVNGIARSHIARLTPNGLLDIGFFPQVDAIVFDVHLQNDGKILLGGDFTQLNGLVTNRIARLLPDGNPDPGFDVGTGANYEIYAIDIQSNNKIIIGGRFSQLDGNPISRMGRLQPNGSVDVNFNHSTTTDNSVFALAVQSDDTILAGGIFQNIASQNQAFLARFNRSGQFDGSFTPNLNSFVLDFYIQNNGNVLLAGAFNQYDGNTLQGVAQLKPDGQLDNSFGLQSQATFENGLVQTLAVQADDKILIGGLYTLSMGIDRNNLARLYPNGQFDKTLNPALLIGDYVSAIAYDHTGSSYIGGQFSLVNTQPHENLAKLTPDGFADASFSTNINGKVNTIVVSSQFRRLLIGGDFSFVDDLAANNIVMTTLGGIRDNSFNAFTDGEVNAILELPNGQYMIGGNFDNISGFARQNLAVINVDGSIEPNFTADTNSSVNSLILQDDGRVIVGGAFDLIKGVLRNGIARMLLIGNQGFIDTFDPNPQVSNASGSTVYAMQFQADGKLLVTGSFVTINGVARDGLARLILDNSPDNVVVDGLNLPLNQSGVISSMALSANGGIIIGGNFSSIDGIARDNMARINANDQVDLGFRADTNFAVTALALMPDGKVMAGGPFTQINGVDRNHLARLSQTTAATKTFKLTHLNKQNAINSWRLDWKLSGSHPQITSPPQVSILFNDANQEPISMTWHENQWELNFTTVAKQQPISAVFDVEAEINSGVFNRSQSLLNDSFHVLLVEDLIFKDGFDGQSNQ